MTPPRSTIRPTIDRTQASQPLWDAVVIGAGPAGSLAARQLAAQGAAVLLLDKSSFPRWKVCGCCLNGAALGVLREVGLGDLTTRLGATPLQRWRLCTTSGQHAVCRLPHGAALSREAFDAGLIEAAIAAGAAFLDEAPARVLPLAPNEQASPARQILLSSETEPTTLTARVVLAADGLGGRSLEQEPGMAPVVREDARVGAGVVLDEGRDFAPGVIFMACAAQGYVGLVRLEDGRLDLAAALDREALKAAGSPAALAADILRRTSLPVPPQLAEGAWRGTPLLTRRRNRSAAHRLLVLGDAAGYVEPFTGEGIAWALQSAAAVVPSALKAQEGWSVAVERQWESTQRRLLGRRQRTCSWVGALLRRPRLTAWTTNVLHWAPWLAAPVIHAVNTAPRQARPSVNPAPH